MSDDIERAKHSYTALKLLEAKQYQEALHELRLAHGLCTTVFRHPDGRWLGEIVMPDNLTDAELSSGIEQAMAIVAERRAYIAAKDSKP